MDRSVSETCQQHSDFLVSTAESFFLHCHATEVVTFIIIFAFSRIMILVKRDFFC